MMNGTLCSWHGILRRTVTVAALAALAASSAFSGEETIDVEGLSKGVDIARMRRNVEKLASFGSRVPGHKGNEAAARFLVDYLKQPALGLQDVGTHRFRVPSPVNKGTELSVTTGRGSETIAVRPFWPNLSRTTTCSIGADKAVPLIYAQRGELSDYNGVDVAGSVVLLDFASGMKWLDAANLGAKAVIFIEPAEALRGEAEAKFLMTPLDFPRFWIERREGQALAARCEDAATARAEAKAQKVDPAPWPVTCSVKSRVDWENSVVENVYAFFRAKEVDTSGMDAAAKKAAGKRAKELIILSSHFDSTSVVPDIAPGAEGATGAAGLLELCHLYAGKPLDRDVLVLFTNAHYQTLKGMRYFYDLADTDLDVFKERIAELKIEAWQARVLSEAVAKRLELKADAEQKAFSAAAVAFMKETTDFAEKLTGEAPRLPIDPVDDMSGTLEEADDQLAEWGGDVAARVEERLRALRLMKELTEKQATEKAGLEAELSTLWRVKDKIRGFSRYTKLSDDEKKVVDARYDELRVGLAEELLRVARDVDGQREVYEHNRKLRGLVDNYGNVFLMGLDLSSRSKKVGLFFKGQVHRQRTKNMERLFSDIGERANLHTRKIETELGLMEGAAYVDAIRVVQGWTWDTYIPENGKIALDVEVANAAGEKGRIHWKGLCVVPVNDSRLYIDTPHDTPERVKWENVGFQMRFVAPLLRVLLDDPEIMKTISLNDNTVGPSNITGTIVRKGGARSVFADRPVPDAIVIRKWTVKSYMGVKANDLVMTDGKGRFNFINTMNYHRGDMEVYVNDLETGRTIYVHDKGQTRTAPTACFFIRVYSGEKTCRIPVFRCESMSVIDLVDQRFLKQLTKFSLVDARSESTPQTFGAARPELGEPVFTIYGKPAARFKIIVSAGELGVRMALLNIDPEAAEAQGPDAASAMKGIGFSVSEENIIRSSSYRAAQDMYYLDEWRIRTLVKHSIDNKRLYNPKYAEADEKGESTAGIVPGLHNITKVYLDQAAKALEEQQYDQFVELSRSAWASESRAYPDVRGTQDDTVVGVIFYLFLVLPFCYFLERLIFGFVKIEHQIIGFFGFFVLVFMVLWVVHPAFELTRAPAMVLLAFIILALSMIVIGIIYSKFSTELKALRETRRVAGQSSADVNRLSASAVAVSLGISNMRRRKIRTALTTITIVILTFTALSFTSVVTSIRKPRVELDVVPSYSGILMKDPAWGKMDEPVYRILRNRYERMGSVVAPRAWYISEDPNKQTKIRVVRSTDVSRSFTAVAAVGMGPSETRVFDSLEDTLHEGGSWFASDTGLEVILADEVLAKLGLSPDEALGVEVDLLGARFKIIGVVKTDKFDSLLDINNEGITPIDYKANEQPSVPGGGQAQAGQAKQLALADAQLGKTYAHLSVSQVAIVPYRTAITLGGTLRSVTIRFAEDQDEDTRKIAIADLLSRMEVNFYASTGEKSFLYASVGATSLSGLKNLIIPILIASLIIFNTMVGSVYERNREIHIFSSLGLAPGHIGSLFLTESVVYATLGAMSGYLFGQVTASIITHFDLLQGLTLNYSSLSTVSTTMIVMLAVIGSTIYPSIQAARIAVPSADRRWGVPEPNGDEILIEMPFTFPYEHLLGINQFMHEFFSAHAEATVGKFYAREISFDVVETPQGDASCLYFMAWLTPYDLGVSQEVQIYTVPTAEGSYVIELALYRGSGYVSSWTRANFPFLNTIRKQFLMWRTLTNEQRDGLQADGKGLLSQARREPRIPEGFAATAAVTADEAPDDSDGGDDSADEGGAH